VAQEQTTNWDDVRVFLALARRGSARAASVELGVSHTTISRRVEGLEASLGTRLFDRDVGGYRLTGAGEVLLSSAEHTEDILYGAERRLQGRDAQLSGDVRITTSEIIATHMLMPEVARFAAQYPDIDLEILVSDDLFDLNRRDADIALRFMAEDRGPPDHLIGRKLVSIASCYYAAPDYLGANDLRAGDTSAHWIGWGEESHFPKWVAGSPFPNLPARGRFNHVNLQVQAAVAGMGLAALPCFVGDQTAGLVRVPGCEPYSNYDVWLLSHPDLKDVARLRTFRAFVVELFDGLHGQLSGE
jgi:DNA-binding transcriptional LysR family regulator